ncbi:MAG: ABC transporter ATP-binding protein [Dermatophilaceae bacterium]
MAEPGLVVDTVTVRFGAMVAVDAVDLRVEPATVVAVLGPSGCGKSTLLRAVAGIEPLTAGSIRMDGADLADTPTHRRGFAMMFQDGQLFAHLDVAGNVGYALRRKGIRGASLTREVDRLLELVDLRGYGARRPATLSGGEAQRVALARALAAHPRLLLLDEPLSALDRALRERLAVDLRAALAATATSALLVTHDQDEAFTVADRTALMRAGQLVQQGATAQVWRHPADAEAALFLGYAAVVDAPVASRLGIRCPAGQAVALQRRALRADPQGPIEGVCRSALTARDGIHLQVDVATVTLPAVADLDAAPVPGEAIRLRLHPRDTAVLPVGALVAGRTSN